MSKLTEIQTYLVENGLQLAILSDPVTIHYVTGFACDPHERQLFLFVFDKSEPFLFTPQLEVNKASQVVDFPVIGYVDSENPWKKIAAQLPKRDLQGIGAEFHHLNLEKFYNLRELFNEDFVNLTPLIQGMRLIKSADEIEKMHIAGDYADQAMKIGFEHIAANVTETDIVSKIDFGMKQAGVTRMSFDTMVLTGNNTADPHGEPGTNPIENNNLLLFDLGVEINGYTSDMTRTVAVGEPTAFQKEIYDLCLRAHLAAIEMIRPGVTAHEIDRAARSIIEEAGYGEYFNHRLGHGLGVEVHEFPSIMEGNNLVIQEGMCFSVEPGIYIPGKVGVRIEDCGVVTKDGFEVFTHTPKELLYFTI